MIVFGLLRVLLARQKLSLKHFFTLYALTLSGVFLLFLGVTGRLHPVFVVLGAVLPLLGRIIPWLMRGMQAFNLFKMFKPHVNLSGAGASGVKRSEIDSRFLHMVLEHATGMMDGTVKEGTFAGAQLSNLNLTQLLGLLGECSLDNDSLNLLTSYLDRQHPEWQSNGDRTGSTPSMDDAMNENQALEILGLSPGACREEIVEAHRKLIQKMHPDRGGSTYLAARINEAKDWLLEARK